MKYKHSLRNRILIAFGLFGLALSLVYWLTIDLSIHFVEDLVFENRLQNEITDFLVRYHKSPDAVPPRSKYIKGYLGLHNVPSHLFPMVKDLPQGDYETGGINSIEGQDGFHVAVRKLPTRDEMLYLFYDVGTFKMNEKYETLIDKALFLTTLLVALLGTAIGALISRRVIAPVTELADRVARRAPDDPPAELSKGFARDEVGFLAVSLEENMQRVQSFIQRERAFTRDASHELRTPVTVIQGAVELMAGLPVYQNPRLKKLADRIERSTRGMALTIDTFLWLAREDFKQDLRQRCHILTEVREAFTECQDLFNGKAIQAELKEKADPTITAPAAVFRIVLNNLLRNAFYHTPEGKISLTVNQDRLELFNTSPFADGNDIDTITQFHARRRESDGFGFGLSIVTRLCDRFGWRLHIQDDTPRGTMVTLTFTPNPVL